MSLELKQQISDTIFSHGIVVSQKMIGAIYDLFILLNPEFRYRSASVDKQIALMDKVDSLAMEHFDVNPKQLYGQARNRVIADCRDVCMYIARKYTGMTLHDVSRRYNKRDHTACIHANRKIKNLLENDESIRAAVGYIQSKLTEFEYSSLPIAV